LCHAGGTRFPVQLVRGGAGGAGRGQGASSLAPGVNTPSSRTANNAPRPMSGQRLGGVASGQGVCFCLRLSVCAVFAANVHGHNSLWHGNERHNLAMRGIIFMMFEVMARVDEWPARVPLCRRWSGRGSGCPCARSRGRDETLGAGPCASLYPSPFRVRCFCAYLYACLHANVHVEELPRMHMGRRQRGFQNPGRKN